MTKVQSPMCRVETQELIADSGKRLTAGNAEKESQKASADEPRKSRAKSQAGPHRGALNPDIRESVIFAKIFPASHAFSLSPWPPSPSDGEGGTGVRAGRGQVLSPCPLSIGWRGGAGVRFAKSFTVQPLHTLVRRFGSGYAGLGTRLRGASARQAPAFARGFGTASAAP